MGFLSLIARLGADTTEFNLKMKQAEGTATQLGNHISGHIKGTLAAAFGVGAILEFTRRTIELGSHVKDLSEQFDMTPGQVQDVEAAMKRAGLEFGNFATAMDIMSAKRKEAAQGNIELQKTFYDLGLSVKDVINLGGKSSFDLMMQIGNKTRGGMTDATRTRLRDIFGRGGPKLGRALSDMSEAPGKMSDQTVDILDKTSDVVKESGRGTMGFFAKRFANLFDTFFFTPLEYYAKLGIPQSSGLKSPAALKGAPPFVPILPGKSAREQHLERTMQIRSFDPLNKIGGFAQRGDIGITSFQDKLVRATEDTAKNTKAIENKMSSDTGESIE